MNPPPAMISNLLPFTPAANPMPQAGATASGTSGLPVSADNGEGAQRSAFAAQLDEASRPKTPTPETARPPEKQAQPAAPKRQNGSNGTNGANGANRTNASSSQAAERAAASRGEASAQAAKRAEGKDVKEGSNDSNQPKQDAAVDDADKTTVDSDVSTLLASLLGFPAPEAPTPIAPTSTVDAAAAASAAADAAAAAAATTVTAPVDPATAAIAAAALAGSAPKAAASSAIETTTTDAVDPAVAGVAALGNGTATVASQPASAARGAASTGRTGAADASTAKSGARGADAVAGADKGIEKLDQPTDGPGKKPVAATDEATVAAEAPTHPSAAEASKDMSAAVRAEPVPVTAEARAELPSIQSPLPTAMAAVTSGLGAMTRTADVPVMQLPAPVGTPEFAPMLGAQVSLMLKDGVQEARIQLTPQEMGPITVQIQIEGNAAQVNMAAENPLTRQALEQSMPNLASSLRESGLTLTGGGVFEQPRQPQDSGDGGDRRNPSGGSRGAGGDVEADMAAAPRRPTAGRGMLDMYA